MVWTRREPSFLEWNAIKGEGLLGTGVEYCGVESNGVPLDAIDGFSVCLKRMDLCARECAAMCVCVSIFDSV